MPHIAPIVYGQVSSSLHQRHVEQNQLVEPEIGKKVDLPYPPELFFLPVVPFAVADQVRFLEARAKDREGSKNQKKQENLLQKFLAIFKLSNSE